MRIERVETFVTEQQLETPFYFSQFGFDTRQICLVKVVAEDGSYGWGEGYGPATVVKAGVEFLSPLVVGEDALQVEAIWNKMHLRSLDYARRGVLVAALSAIDIAIGTCAANSWGSRYRCYWVAGGVNRSRYMPPECTSSTPMTWLASW